MTALPRPARWIGWVGLLAVGTLVATMASAAQPPQPKVRVIATIPGVQVDKVVRLPSGRALLYSVPADGPDSLFAYDLSTKRSALVSLGNPHGLVVSRKGDRIAFSREDQDGDFIWSLRIDPRSGTATGPALRVSTMEGYAPSFSPDGRLIAFATESRDNHPDVVVVPAMGGPQQVLARYQVGIGETSWSGDGKSVFVQVGATPRSIERIPLSGGPSERVLSYSGESRGSIDGRVVFYRPDARARSEGRIAYLTVSDVRGEFRIPPQSETGTPLGAVRSALVKLSRPSTTRIVSLADGTVRELPPGTTLSSAGGWSPDGRRLALAGPAGDRYQITLTSGNGTVPQSFPISVDPSAASLRWSPDSQILAYSTGIGSPNLALLDPTSGVFRNLFSARDANFLDFIWRPDGRAIVLVKSSKVGGTLAREVFETGLDGTSRKLGDFDNQFPMGHLVSDRLFLGGAEGDGAGGDLTNRYAVIPSRGGTWLALAGGVGRRGAPGVSHDGRWLAFLLRMNGVSQRRSVELVTTQGDSSRILSLPFDAQFQTPEFHPDGRHLILVGQLPSDSLPRVFLVPLDGSAPRVLATLPGTAVNPRMALSPNGGNLVFSFEGPPTSTIYELDLSPLLRSVIKP